MDKLNVMLSLESSFIRGWYNVVDTINFTRLSLCETAILSFHQLNFSTAWLRQLSFSSSLTECLCCTSSKRTGYTSWHFVSRFGLAVRRSLVSGRTSVRYRFGSPFFSKRLWFVDTVLWLCPSLSTETLKWLSSLPILMQESFWWCQCIYIYIISHVIPLSPASTHAHVYTHTHTHTRTHARTHARTHTRTHARTHTHTHTHIPKKENARCGSSCECNREEIAS